MLVKLAFGLDFILTNCFLIWLEWRMLVSIVMWVTDFFLSGKMSVSALCLRRSYARALWLLGGLRTPWLLHQPKAEALAKEHLLLHVRDGLLGGF